jgi:hypothetical protein
MRLRVILGVVIVVLSTSGCSAGPTEAELRDQGYVDCSAWAGQPGIWDKATCIYEGELVEYQDTPYHPTDYPD